MARRGDEFDGMDSAQEFTGDTSAADMLSQYFGETPTDLPPAPEDTTALAQLRELVRMEEERRAAEAQATRPMDQPFVETVMPTDESVNLAPPPAVSGLPPGVTQADLDAIAAGFRDAGYGPNNNFLSQGIGLSGIGLGGSYMPGGPAEMTTPAINFTGDPNQPFFDMRTPEGGVDPRYFVPGLTSPAINTVGPTDRGIAQRKENECPPGLEYDYELGRCVRPDVPRTTPPPTTEPPSTTPPPTTEPPATTPPPTTAPPTTPPPTTRPPQSCPPGYIYNPETRQCEALITSPPPTTAPPTTPPPTTAPPTTAPPSPTPPPTTRPPVTCPPGYALNAAGQCAPIDLGPCPAGYVRSTITGRCEPTTTGTPPPGTTAPPTTAPPTTPPPTSGCKQGEIYSTTLGKCVPITTEAPPTTAPPATTAPPPGVITKFDPSTAMLEAYKRMFGTGVVNLGQSTPINTGTTTSPLVATTGVNTPIPGTATAGSPVPLPGFQNVTFTPGQPQFFGQTGGLLPGTVPSGYNPIGNYKGPLPGQMIAQNPNLSPTILGGLQGLGYYVDRLGNRIMSPGGGFMRFAEGGEADKEEAAAQSAQAELRALLEAMPAETKTEVSVSPTARSVRQTKKKAVDTGKAKGISMSLEESMASIEPPSRASARDQLAALMRRNRGLAAKTFSTPTLDRASLAARGPLTTKRFQDGGEARSKLNELLESTKDVALGQEKRSSGTSVSRNTQRYFEEKGQALRGNEPAGIEREAQIRSKIGPEYRELVDKNIGEAAMIGLPTTDMWSAKGVNFPEAGQTEEELSRYIKKTLSPILKEAGTESPPKGKRIFGIGRNAVPQIYAHELRHEEIEDEERNRAMDLVNAGSRPAYEDGVDSLYSYYMSRDPMYQQGSFGEQYFLRDRIPFEDKERYVLNKSAPVLNYYLRKETPFFGREEADRFIQDNYNLNALGAKGAFKDGGKKLAKERIEQRARYPFLNFVGRENMPILEGNIPLPEYLDAELQNPAKKKKR